MNLDNRQPLAGGTLSLELRKEEKEVWPGVDMTRALFLTREYLCDVFQLVSDRPRRYDWHVHALGLPVLDGPWKPTGELHDALYDLDNRAVAARLSDPVERDRYQLHDVMKLENSQQPWTATVVQSCGLPDARKSILGSVWYDRKIGVCVRMLGEPGTSVYVGRTPVAPKPASGRAAARKRTRERSPNSPMRLAAQHSWSGGASRRPFLPPCTNRSRTGAVSRGSPRSAALPRTAKGSEWRSKGPTDRPSTTASFFAIWEDYDQPLTLAGEGESFTFADRAFLRIGKAKVEVSGDLRAMRSEGLRAARPVDQRPPSALPPGRRNSRFRHYR